MFLAFGEVFIVCELSEGVVNAFDEISYLVGQFNWYLFPNQLQHVLTILIAFTQHTVNFPCFGSISCNHEAFKKVSILTRKRKSAKLLHVNI